MIREALDPRRVVLEKTALGGTHPDEVSRQLDLIEAQIKNDEKVLEERRAQLAKADALLAQKVKEALS